MKAFKIKKRNYRQSIFIIGPPIVSFDKPELPFILINNIHPPTFKPKFIFEVEQEQQEALQLEAEPVAEPELEAEWEQQV